MAADPTPLCGEGREANDDNATSAYGHTLFRSRYAAHRRSQRMNAILSLVTAWLASPSAARTTEYVNGYWFDGSRFSRRTGYVVGDVLSFHRPQHVDASVDLNDGY